MSKSISWYLCTKCTCEVVKDCQDHERLIIKDPAFASGECSVCYGPVRFIVKVQEFTHRWLLKFTFNKKYQARIKALST